MGSLRKFFETMDNETTHDNDKNHRSIFHPISERRRWPPPANIINFNYKYVLNALKTYRLGIYIAHR